MLAMRRMHIENSRDWSLFKYPATVDSSDILRQKCKDIRVNFILDCQSHEIQPAIRGATFIPRHSGKVWIWAALPFTRCQVSFPRRSWRGYQDTEWRSDLLSLFKSRLYSLYITICATEPEIMIISTILKGIEMHDPSFVLLLVQTIARDMGIVQASSSLLART